MTAALVPQQEARALTLSSAAMTIQEIVAQKKLIAQAMQELMQDGEHYGTIPGAKKKSLWKPGADLLCSLFQLDADYLNEEVVHEPGYIYYRLKCVLKHIPSGRVVGAGLGSCNSREEKYRRAAPKKCPKCDKEAIKRSKYPDRDRPRDEPGWYCHDKAGGCGANFRYEDKTITEQDTGIADPSDLDNTILKMAAKRSRIDAVLTVTGASDFFTQDVEDLSEKARRLVVIDVHPEATPPQKEGSDPKAQAAPSSTTTATADRSSSRTSSTMTATTTGTTGAATAGSTTTKPPLAPSIKHNGVFANHKQIAYLHILKTKAGIADCDGKCAKEVKQYSKRANGLVPKTVRCTYHTQLAAFRDCDGKPITTSKDLSEDQISNLITRYENKTARQEVRGTETPEIPFGEPSTTSQPPTTTRPAGNASGHAAGGTAGPVDGDDELSEVRAALDEKGDEKLLDELCEVFRIPSLDMLPVAEAPAALALVMAWGTKSYATVLERVRP